MVGFPDYPLFDHIHQKYAFLIIHNITYVFIAMDILTPITTITISYHCITISIKCRLITHVLFTVLFYIVILKFRKKKFNKGPPPRVCSIERKSNGKYARTTNNKFSWGNQTSSISLLTLSPSPYQNSQVLV